MPVTKKKKESLNIVELQKTEECKNVADLKGELNMDLSTTACILIDKSSPMWEEMKLFLENHQTNFAACDNVTFRVISEHRRPELAREIGDLLRYIGMPSHVHGYQYLVTAIEMAYYDPSLIHKVTKDLYPPLARKFHTTISGVERSIRQAIILTWTEQNADKLYMIFRSLSDVRPICSEFIAVMVNYLREWNRESST